MTTTVAALKQDIGLARETDYYLMKDQLTQDELGLLYKVRQFAEAEILPVASSYWERDEFPFELVPKLAGQNIVGDTMAGYGTTPMSAVGAGLVMYEVSRVDGSLGTFLGVHVGLAMQSIYLLGSEEQKQRWLPGMAAGEAVGCFGLTEPDRGSDPGDMQTRARRDGTDWVLTGRKMWITNGPVADTLVVYAKTDAAAGPRGISAFIIEKGMKGFSTAQKLDKLGMRGSDTCELVFENCEVPEENVLSEVGRGVNVLMSGLDYERAVLAAGPLGIMQACLDVVLPYVHERKQFGQPIGTFQLVQGKIADMYTTMNASRAYVYAVAKACDRGETTREDAAGAILYASEKATQCALDAIQLLGGNGYINDYPTGRLLRDAKLYEIGAGTSEIRRMLIGRELFEKSA
jgi:isovaleryl-CoA dehydrogenase